MLRTLVLVAATAVAAQSQSRPHTFGEVMVIPSRAADQRVAYGSAPEQFGELWLPTGAGKHPVVVFIHGGCWRSAYDVTQSRPLATALADSGFAVWSIEYRRVGSPGGGWPSTFTDVGAALDHLRVIAKTAPLDLARVAVAGHSAGGQLALWSGARSSLLAASEVAASAPLVPRAVIGLGAITDLARYASAAGCGSAVVPLMGGTVAEQAARYAQVSPVERPSTVPATLIVASADAIVPRAQADALRAVRASAGLEVVEGAGHFDLIAPEGASFTALLRALRSALR